MLSKIKKSVSFAVCVISGVLLGVMVGFSLFGGNGDILCHALNGQYEVGRIPVSLRDGVYYQLDKTDGQMMTEIKLAALPVRGRINGDGRDDAAVIISSRASGQLPYFYVAAALGINAGAEYTNSVYIGEGIEILGLELDAGVIWVFTLEHVDGESRESPPGIERVHQYIMRDGALHEMA